jgi:L-lactate permease
MTADRALLWLMRLNAAVLLCAAPCAFLPFATMDALHRELLGAELPDLPITRYMARSLSLLYASYGLITLFVTLDWQQYRPAVPFIAWLHIAFASAMVIVDWEAGMPWWWVLGEGPPLIGMGFLMLWLYRRASRTAASDP